MRLDQTGVRGRDPQTGNVRYLSGHTWSGREPKRRLAEPEREQLGDVRARVEDEIASGDAHVQRAGGDVDRDVTWPAEVALDAVVLANEDQVAPVGATPVTGPAAHLARRC